MFVFFFGKLGYVGIPSTCIGMKSMKFHTIINIYFEMFFSKRYTIYILVFQLMTKFASFGIYWRVLNSVKLLGVL